VEEVVEQKLLIRGRAFATFSIIEKVLAGCKKSMGGPYVVQGCSTIKKHTIKIGLIISESRVLTL